MKVKSITLIALLLCIGIFTEAQTEIRTAEELAAINSNETSLKGRYILMNDITIENWTPIGDAEAPFLGLFDGNGHTITIVSIGNVYSAPFRMKSKVDIPAIETNYIGIFGFNGRRSVIQNLQVDGEITFESNYNIMAGGVTGANYGTVRNCISNVSVSSTGYENESKTNPDNSGDCFAGGITGINNGIIRNCYSTGNITAKEGVYKYAGGITGLNDFDEGIIQWCYATGNISATGSAAERYAGGIAGFCSQGGLVQYCVALNKNIVSDKTENSFTGRIIGLHQGRAGGNFSRRDINLTNDNSNPNGRDLYEFSSLQDIEWWTVNRHIRFAFGSDVSRPWAWDNELNRPVMHWESGATQENISARRNNTAPGTSSQNKIEIRNTEELSAIGADLSTLKKNYILMNDITVENWTPIGMEKGNFSGTFDGNGYTITILSIRADTLQTRNIFKWMGIGLFCSVNGHIKNLHVAGDIRYSSGTKTLYIGAITGMNEGTITRCVSTANISGNGGIYTKGRGTANFFLGAAMGGVILYQNGAYAGGITGINKNVVTNCYSTGDISIAGEGYKSAGGIAGGNGVNGGHIVNCYATGKISAKEDGGVRFAGGIAGMNSWSATIENSVALNEELIAVGKSNGVALDGTGLMAHNNVRYSVGVNMGTQNQVGKLIQTYYRHDMKITKEKEAKTDDEFDNETDNDSKSGKGYKRQLVDYATTQNKEWWVGAPKKFEFNFGTEEKAPWVWDDELKRPVLYWQTDVFTPEEPTDQSNESM
ncbi:MAG: hypothetical protein LBV74_03000 [Tannerella sp.]|nr:hypothetical protein [Tannerella sp.]